MTAGKKKKGKKGKDPEPEPEPEPEPPKEPEPEPVKDAGDAADDWGGFATVGTSWSFCTGETRTDMCEQARRRRTRKARRYVHDGISCSSFRFISRYCNSKYGVDERRVAEPPCRSCSCSWAFPGAWLP